MLMASVDEDAGAVEEPHPVDGLEEESDPVEVPTTAPANQEAVSTEDDIAAQSAMDQTDLYDDDAVIDSKLDETLPGTPEESGGGDLTAQDSGVNVLDDILGNDAEFDDIELDAETPKTRSNGTRRAPSDAPSGAGATSLGDAGDKEASAAANKANDDGKGVGESDGGSSADPKEREREGKAACLVIDSACSDSKKLCSGTDPCKAAAVRQRACWRGLQSNPPRAAPLQGPPGLRAPGPRSGTFPVFGTCMQGWTHRRPGARTCDAHVCSAA